MERWVELTALGAADVGFVSANHAREGCLCYSTARLFTIEDARRRFSSRFPFREPPRATLPKKAEATGQTPV